MRERETERKSELAPASFKQHASQKVTKNFLSLLFSSDSKNQASVFAFIHTFKFPSDCIISKFWTFVVSSKLL
jgi:hypothetical protein